MSLLCSKELCTMCEACMAICPKGCITKKREGMLWYSHINDAECVDCGLCRKTCPNETKPEWNDPECVYAAWVNNKELRRDSASGGIASALYKYAVSNGMYIVGVKMDEKFEAHFKVAETEEAIQEFQNSKYTYSYMDDSYQKIANLLKEKKAVVFVGLPCQVGGLKNYLKIQKINVTELITVDLICHGTPVPEYLLEHIHAIEKRKGQKTEICSFREKKYGTQNFVFSLKGKNKKLFYKKIVESDDLYQIGYHRGWIYRENCYHCQYAQKQRCGDFTIGDYSGLGKKRDFNSSKDKVSCLFVNTQKGRLFLKSIQKGNIFQLEERPLMEAYTYNSQLSYPSKEGNSHERTMFVHYLNGGGGYEAAAGRAFASVQTKNRIKEIIQLYWIKTTVKKMIPIRAKNFYHRLKNRD